MRPGSYGIRYSIYADERLREQKWKSKKIQINHANAVAHRSKSVLQFSARKV